MKKSKEIRYRNSCIRLLKKEHPEIDFEKESGFSIHYTANSPFISASYSAMFLNKLSPNVLNQLLVLPYKL